MRDPRSMGCVHVGETEQRLERGSCLFQVADARHHVDDWFGGDSWDRCGTDVVNAVCEPGRKHHFENGTFLLKTALPVRVVRNQGDDAGGHEADVIAERRRR